MGGLGIGGEKVPRFGLRGTLSEGFYDIELDKSLIHYMLLSFKQSMYTILFFFSWE